MNSLIIGTAGHIDHGKSSLIKAMNGFDGDELALEKEKGITINLSFSHLQNAQGANIAFIDVPGHENLVKTMISGAFSFSVCLFVVDINEGLKAQSVEHLQILRLLGCESIILVLSKCDLCENIAEKKEEILKNLKPFKMQILNSFCTSIKDESSIDELKHFLFTLKTKPNDGRLVFRYYIDRVFTLKGIGTVVTGSLNEGCVELNEKIFCLDINKDLLVKNVQIQGQNVSKASAYNRVALSLNCDYKELKKGFLLSKKGFFKGFKEADGVVFAKDLPNKSTVLFCVGSRQVSAKMTLLKEFDEKYFVHFDFEKTVFLCFDERFILLENSRLKAGGRILNPVSEPLKKEQKIQLLNLLEVKDFLSSFEFLKSTHKLGFGLLSSYQRFKLTHSDALVLAKSLNNVFVDEKELNVYDLNCVQNIKEFVYFLLSKNEYAMLSPNLLSLRLGWASEALCEFVLKSMSKELDFEGGIYFKKGMSFEKLERKNHDALYEILKKEGIKPTAPYNLYDFLELDRAKGDAMLKKLTKNGLVVRLTHNLFIEKNALAGLEKACLELLQRQSLDIQKMKAHFGLSRKYAIAYLEWLDKNDKIIKDGETRRLRA
mgnify:FL=1